MSGKFYVYTHSRETTGEVFYVGKGCGRRAWERSRRQQHWQNVANRHGRIVRIVASGLTEGCALSIEKMLIFAYGKDNLVNRTDGGLGNSGYIMPPEQREHMRRINLGKLVSDETRVKISCANKGRTISQEHRKAVGRATAIRPYSEKQRLAVAKANSLRNVSVETRKKISESRKDRTEYTFYHPDHGMVTAILSHFQASYGVGVSNLRKVLNGKYTQCNGWRLTP